MIRRNTIQKDLVLKAVQDLKRHLTADEVYEYIKKDHPNIGKGTVYRNLGILAEEGAIRRVEIPDGPDRFDFTLKNHYHVRCVKCGAVSDVDMDVIPDLMDRIKDKHGMHFLDYDICFKGVCADCAKKMS
jgi:Fur family transcriptional regulator, ferric uptake regulator